MTQSRGRSQQTQTRALRSGKGAHELHGAGSMRLAGQSQVHQASMCSHLFLLVVMQGIQAWDPTPVTCSFSGLKCKTKVRQATR